MEQNAEFFIKRFFRTYPEVFTVKDFQKFLGQFKIHCKLEECRELLSEADNLFLIDENHFITRAGAFTGRYFSFKPTRKEIDKGVFLPGHRCLPFVDSFCLSCSLNFRYKNKLLPTKIETFTSDFVMNELSLYGEEFAFQYISGDPANVSKHNLMNADFTLPSELEMTAISLEPLIKDGLKSGDRILCRVTDWDKGKIDLKIDKANENPFLPTKLEIGRNAWYDNLENFFYDSLEFMGPRSSIEDQLAIIFFNGAQVFCNKDCGSMEEFIARSKKIGIENFGVETRIWKKGEDVPAIGGWNGCFIDEAEQYRVRGSFQPMIPLHEYVTNCFVKDMIFFGDTDFSALLEKMYPCHQYYTDEQKKRMLLHLQTVRDILTQNYNRFADSEISAIRHKALELYAIVNGLVNTVEIEGNDLKSLPQQPLVILSQIYNNVSQILEMLEDDVSSVLKEMYDIDLSLDGMECNFEAISEELHDALSSQRRKGFKIIKD